MTTPREDLVSSAIEFLRDPKVTDTPLDKKRAFLEYKKLTPAEIDLAIARTSGDPSAAPPFDPYANSSQPSPYSSYPPRGYPQQSLQYAPLEPLRRDWRDWFIMATVTTGVGYGLYTLAKRYVTPLISPPTPPQLEQDKASIDANFDKAFTLIDQLATDTAALKTAEENRTQRLDSSLAEVDTVVSELKAALAEKEKEARRIRADISGLKESIPQALQGFKAEHERRLAEVGSELRSLKMLVGNRVGVQAAGGNLARPAVGGSGTSVGMGTSSNGGPGVSSGAVNGTGSGSGASTPTPYAAATNATKNEAQEAEPSFKGPGGAPGFSFEASNKRSIPAWQMAAANSAKVEDESSAA